MHSRTIFGIVASLAYVGGVAWLRLPFSIDTLRNVPINELGDALAGLVGPVALLWLVIGYFQQGEELKQNGEALKMQADELKNAVEQYQLMAEAAREQTQLQKEELSFHAKKLEEERAAAHQSRLPRFKALPSVMEMNITEIVTHLKFVLRGRNTKEVIGVLNEREGLAMPLGFPRHGMKVTDDFTLVLKTTIGTRGKSRDLKLLITAADGEIYTQIFRIQATDHHTFEAAETSFTEPES